MTVRLFILLLILAQVASAADWPQYRNDAARSGYTAENLADELTLQWVRTARHPPQRAWVGREFARSRMHFDWTYTPVIAGGRAYFGSSADHKVVAVDAATGKDVWSFFTGGPVRLAPAVWKDSILFGSDDGFFYCLDRRTGQMIWKQMVGPRDERLIGNSRMISRWAVRGGVAVRDGVAYYGAGNWPEEDVYICAVDIATGKLLWRNDNTGALEIDQPHMVCFSRGGVIAQGYLSVTDKKLFVATGRSTPAVFDRSTGDYLYYHLSRYGGKTPWGIGGGDVVAANDYFFNSGLFFDTSTGLRYSDKFIHRSWWKPHIVPGGRRAHGEFHWGARQGAAFTPKGIVRHMGDKLVVSSIAYRTYEAVRDVPTSYDTDRLKFQGMANPAHKTELIDNAPTPEDSRQMQLPAQPLSLIVAGEKAICGLQSSVCVMPLTGETPPWTAELDGPARALAVADGRLFVATDAGSIYCFSQGGEGNTISPARPASSGSRHPRATEILKTSGIRKGYCLVTEADAALIEALVRESDMYVIGLAQGNLEAIRRKLDTAGIYGVRCVVLDTKISDLPEYFANLVITDGTENVDRVLRPYSGVVCKAASGEVVKTRGPLKGAGAWTHNFGNAGNTLHSGDEIAKGPLGMLWYEDETQRTIDRHGKNPSPLAYKGMLLRLGLNSLRCRDAYNGAILYDMELPGVLAAYTEGTQVGGAHIGNVYCVEDDVLYIRMDDACKAYDVFTGKELRTFTAPAMPDGKRGKWGYVACRDGILLGALMNEGYVIRANHGGGQETYQKPMEDHLTESKYLFAFDAQDGKLLWTYKPAESIRNNTLAMGGRNVYLIDREVAQMDRFMRPEIPKLEQAGKLPEHKTGKLLALKARTGDVMWQSDDDVFGTLLSVDPAQDVLLMTYYRVGFARPSEVRTRKIRAYKASSGTKMWESPRLGSRPIMAQGTIYTFPFALDLATGKSKVYAEALADADVGDPWEIEGKSQGCGSVAGSEHLLMMRSATLGYYDLNYDRKWLENYGGFRAGCFLNYLPVMGLVLVPDDTLACRCSYQNQATIALKEYGVRPPVVEPSPGQANFKYFRRSREPFFTGALEVRMWHQRPDLEIRYTTDDSQPTVTSALYKGPITITDTTPIRAAVFKDGMKLEIKDAVIFRKTDDIQAVMQRGTQR